MSDLDTQQAHFIRPRSVVEINRKPGLRDLALMDLA
jgi:hypothetical protein